MNQAQILKAIGFSEGEEKAYLALLKIGSARIVSISKEAGISRSKMYEVLERLSRRGVVSHYRKNNVLYYRAAEPERILEYLDEKTKEINRQKEDFRKQLPLFNQIITEQSIAKEAEVYEGMEGIKIVREEALSRMNPGDVMLYFGNPASAHENALPYWDNWNNRRVEKKISAWIIYNQDAYQYGERRKKLPLTKVKYLPKAGNSHAWIEIYGDVLVIGIKYKTPMSIVVRNKLVAESFKTYFNILWDVSKTELKK